MDGPVPGRGGGAAFRQRGRATEREAGKNRSHGWAPRVREREGGRMGRLGRLAALVGLGWAEFGMAERLGFHF
jgi:hypothetical protein